MAEIGRVVVAGRFPCGALVSLWRVAGEAVLRHEGGELVDTKRVDEAGSVVFKSGVVVGARYLASGYADGGIPLEVRCRGLGAGEESVLSQPPVQPDVVKHADGQVVDGLYSPRRDPRPVAADDETASSESPEAEQAAPVPAEELRGAALDARVKELGLSGMSSWTAAEKREAVAKKETELAAAGATNNDKEGS